MGVSIPSSYQIDITDADVDIRSLPTITVGSVGPVGPVTIEGIPDTYTIHVEELPKIELGIDPLEIKPLDLSLRLTEIPSVRGHLPSDYSLGLSLLGIELVKLRLCGETQVITEPYQPNPCEYCGEPAREEFVRRPRSVATVLTMKEG